jgi:hypothetical protein
MRKAKHLIMGEMWRNIPLFFCGVFLVYVAAVDGTLFQAIAVDVANRLVVAVATVLATTIPMFFAIGSIKQSILVGRETIYYYEKLLKTKAFWAIGGVVSVSIAVLIYVQNRMTFFCLPGLLTAIGCILSGIYLFYYSITLKRSE